MSRSIVFRKEYSYNFEQIFHFPSLLFKPKYKTKKAKVSRRASHKALGP